MHVRFSTSKDLPVVDQDEEKLGDLSGMLIDPDTGKVEGFYVDVPALMGNSTLFCSSMDIRSWGTMIHLRDREVLSPAEDRVRLQNLLADNRSVFGQKICTESGAYLGKCKDVQFDTGKMKITWIFPKRLFGWGAGIPATEIIEVKKEIIVKDPIKPKEEEAMDPAEALEKLQDIADPGIVRPG
ncbi:MAG: PRC-barrel domain-containing protein [Kiritimatiellales bacterium]|nr:PRC-barrel domain-containing protein [Kiritimatiellales bacterium]